MKDFQFLLILTMLTVAATSLFVIAYYLARIAWLFGVPQ